MSEELLNAIRKGDLGRVQKLIQTGSNIHQVTGQNSWIPLMWASACGELEIVKYLLLSGANIKEVSRTGYTALMWASARGELNVVKYLLEAGAEVNQITPGYGRTALKKASYRGHSEVVQYLLEAGAEVNLTSRDDWTPLMWASARGELEVVKILLTHRALVTPKNRTGKTALDLAEKYKNKNRQEIVSLLKNAHGRYTKAAKDIRKV